ncbi:MAG TPA: tRNA pseudouridine(55) synthase TruB [Vicinamibacterales bacterium]|nr:tRNA pseudouridine(55) synthase TruB [Vicinamibacterales bacterium]
MDGVLVVDKPAGLTSHDVVVVARRCLGEPHIGHTGTLDPLATGVLPLACGQATRLIRFLTASDKEYDAGIRFGLTTDSFDITGHETSRSNAVSTREAVDRALGSLRGEYLQTPPAYSAKKVAGERAYVLARRREEVRLEQVPVRVSRAEVLAFDGATARIGIACSAGFYVRAFAHALGELVGTGACLESLRRTRSGEFGLDDAIDLERLQSGRDAWAERLIPIERLLTGFPATTLTDEGRRRVSHGQDVLDIHLSKKVGKISLEGAPPLWIRLLDTEGRLVALATAGTSAGSLHPTVVLI